MKKNLSRALLAFSFAAFLSGCSVMPFGEGAGGETTPSSTTAEGAQPVAPADETKDFAPVVYDNVCLLENAAVKSPKLVDTIEAGLKRSGATVKRLEPGTSPKACPFVITYEVAAEKGVITAVVFQTFEHGIPRMQASGAAPKGRGLTVSMAAGFAHELLGRLKGTIDANGKRVAKPQSAATATQGSSAQ